MELVTPIDIIPLELTAVTTTDGTIQKKVFGSGHPLDLALHTTTLTISNEKMNDIMKIVKSLKESSLLIKSISKTIKNEAKEQKGEFLSMLLGTLGASLLGNQLTSKNTIRAGEDTTRAGQGFECCLIL